MYVELMARNHANPTYDFTYDVVSLGLALWGTYLFNFIFFFLNWACCSRYISQVACMPESEAHMHRLICLCHFNKCMHYLYHYDVMRVIVGTKWRNT